MIGRALGVLAVGTFAFGSLTWPGRAGAAGEGTLADWRMDEPEGARLMSDGSGNGLDGIIGTGVRTGRVDGETIYYQWPFRPPNQPPADPERLIQVQDPRLNPGVDDYAITLRFRTTHSFGNILQKGQAGSPTGYFKLEIANGNLRCLFRGLDPDGALVRRSVTSGDTLLNDGAWHVARCARSGVWLTLTVDGQILDRRLGPLLSVANDVPFVIGGKLNCDQVRITCDYFSGDVDFVAIAKGSGDASPPAGDLIFADDFDAGFSRWSSMIGMTIDEASGSPLAPSARASVADARAFALAPLPRATSEVCASVDVLGPDLTAVTLFRLRAVDGSPIVRVRVDTGGFLRVRSDVSGLLSPRSVVLGSGWHTVRLCGTIGASGTWTLTRDGVAVLEGWTADTGTEPAGVLQIGEAARATWTANLDHVIVEDMGV